MTLPSFLNCPFRYTGIVTDDVADIITALRDELLNQLPVGSRWTEPVAGTFQSPDYGDGCWYSITVARVAQNQISYALKDNWGLWITCDTGNIITQNIAATPVGVSIFTSPYYVYIDTGNGAGGGETFLSGIMDRTPEPLTRPRACFFSTRGPRNNLGSMGSYHALTQMITLPVGTAAYYAGGSVWHDRIVASGNYGDQVTVGGTLRYQPMEYVSSNWFLGRAFNLVMGDGNAHAYGTEVVLPLDGITTGRFRTLAINNNNSTYNWIKCLARVA